MKLILHHQVIKVVNQDVYIYGIILMELDKVQYKLNKNLKLVHQKQYGRKQMIKVKYLIVFLFQLISSFTFLLGNIWRRARVNIPPLLGLSTYKIIIIGIVGAQATGGKKFCFSRKKET